MYEPPIKSCPHCGETIERYYYVNPYQKNWIRTCLDCLIKLTMGKGSEEFVLIDLKKGCEEAMVAVAMLKKIADK